MSMITSVIRGCHDLVILEEYSQAFEILDELIGIEFAIEDHPDTDDTCEDEFLDLHQAVKEGMLSINRSELLHDYIKACSKCVKDSKEAARKIASALEMKLFEACNLYDWMMSAIKEPLLIELKKILAEDWENRGERKQTERFLPARHLVSN